MLLSVEEAARVHQMSDQNVDVKSFLAAMRRQTQHLTQSRLPPVTVTPFCLVDQTVCNAFRKKTS